MNIKTACIASIQEIAKECKTYILHEHSFKKLRKFKKELCDNKS